MNVADRDDLAAALVLWRYLGHSESCYAVARDGNEARTNRALKLAKLIGVRSEYLQQIFTEPVQRVTFESKRTSRKLLE